MNIEDISYLSSNGTDMISAKLFVPTQTDILGVLQICHGMCEYIDRYRAFAQYLCGKGFVVCGNDHIGHKGSVKSEADLGFFGEKDGHLFLVNDVRTLTHMVKEQYPGIPYFLMGHSMGSFVARCCAARFGEEYDGLILSGTGGKNPLAAAGKRLADVFCKTQGARGRSRVLDKLIFGKYNERFEHRTEKDWLTRDKAVVDLYVADSGCAFSFTNAALRDLLELNIMSNAPEWADALPKKLSVYLFSGSEDPVGDYGKGVRQVYDSIKKAGLFDVTLKLYKGGRHEMLNEINRSEVYSDVYEWLKRKI
ncbi:MAG: alpha/beta fold hydrolase [Hydrogenoanaerobacterium sp.]